MGSKLLAPAVILMLVAGAMPFLPAQAHAPPPAADAELGAATLGFSVGDSASSFSWATTATGHRHVRITADFGSVQTCVVTYTAGGLTSTGRPHFFYAGQDDPGKGWGSFAFRDATGAGYTTHGHVTSIALTDPQGFGEWYGSAAITGVMSGDESFLFAGFNLRPNQLIPQANGKSLTVSIDCSHAITITRIEGGTAGYTFEPPAMRGGIGASSGLGPDFSLNVADRVTSTFSGAGDHVYYRYRSDESAAAGIMTLSAPSGSQSILLTGDDDIFLDGAIGGWHTDFSRVAAGEGMDAIGVVVGLADVASLDAVAAL